MLSKACSFFDSARQVSRNPTQIQSSYGHFIRDDFPIPEGYTLNIPKQHISSFVALSEDKRQGMLALLDISKERFVNYSLYRGYDLQSQARIFQFSGAVDKHINLKAKNNKACFN
jgi:hypothetical protein